MITLDDFMSELDTVINLAIVNNVPKEIILSELHRAENMVLMMSEDLKK